MEGLEELFNFEFCVPMLVPVMPESEKGNLVKNLFEHNMIIIGKSKVTPKLRKSFELGFTQMEESNMEPDCVIYLIDYNKTCYES